MIGTGPDISDMRVRCGAGRVFGWILGFDFWNAGLGNGIDLFNPTIAYAPSCPGCSPRPVFIARPAGNKKIKWLFNLFEAESVYNKQKNMAPAGFPVEAIFFT